MKNLKIMFGFWMAMLFVAPSWGQEGVYKIIVEKQKKKEQSRWSLSDWLAQKEHIRAMDLWLAIHSSHNPFEFSVGADSGSVDVESTVGGTSLAESHKQTTAYADAFASIVGLRGRYENIDGDRWGTEASFALRIFGASQQDTNITLEYGQYYKRFTNGGTMSDYKTSFYGGSVSLYLIKYFGLKARYINIQKAESSIGADISGQKMEYEAFIDYGLFRIFGQGFSEELKFPTEDQKRSGILAGFKFFF